MKRKDKILRMLEAHPEGLSATIIGMNIGYDIKDASNNVNIPLRSLLSNGKIIKQKAGVFIYKLKHP